MLLTQLLRKRLVRDERCQARAEFNDEHAEAIAEYLEAGGSVPPVIAFRGPDGDVLADGFHRDRAYEILGRPYVEADIRRGTLRDAILFAVGANAQHTALLRSNADKRKAALILLTDEEWGRWSAREIARATGVSHELVNRLKEQLAELSGMDCQIGDGGVKVQRGGSIYTMRFRDMTPAQQRVAVESETDSCRPGWIREALAGLQAAERALLCLQAAEALASCRAALTKLPGK